MTTGKLSQSQRTIGVVWKQFKLLLALGLALALATLVMKITDWTVSSTRIVSAVPALVTTACTRYLYSTPLYRNPANWMRDERFFSPTVATAPRPAAWSHRASFTHVTTGKFSYHMGFVPGGSTRSPRLEEKYYTTYPLLLPKTWTTRSIY